MNVLLIYSTFEVAVQPPPFSQSGPSRCISLCFLFRQIILEPHLLQSFLLIDMAKTNGTYPYSGSPGEPHCSGRNRKHAHETSLRVTPGRQYQRDSARTLRNYSPAWTLRLSSCTRTRNHLAAIVLLPISAQGGLSLQASWAPARAPSSNGWQPSHPPERSGSAPAQGPGIAQR